MMTTCRFFLLLGALLGLSGCPGGADCVVDAVPRPPQRPGLILVGQEVHLKLTPSVSGMCGGERLELPRSFEVEVSGPDNLPVPSQATLGAPPNTPAHLKFTPDQQGRYHIFAAFEPVGGLQQFDLYAARDRSAEAPAHTLLQSCTALERTLRGGWVCDSSFLRDGKVVQAFGDARVAVAGDVVWAVDTTQIQRFVDTGTALELTASMTDAASTADFLLASETELLALRSSNLSRVTFDGTPELRLKGSEVFPVSGTVGSTGLRGLLIRSGDEVAVIANDSSGSSGQPSNTFTSRACMYRIEPDRLTRRAAPCQSFTGDVVGYEPTGVWVGTRLSFEEELTELRWLELTDAGLVEQASLPLGRGFQVPRHPLLARHTATPVLHSLSLHNARSLLAVPTYAAHRRTILLEILETELLQFSASQHLLWGTPATNPRSLRVRIRPTTP